MLSVSVVSLWICLWYVWTVLSAVCVCCQSLDLFMVRLDSPECSLCLLTVSGSVYGTFGQS